MCSTLINHVGVSNVSNVSNVYQILNHFCLVFELRQYIVHIASSNSQQFNCSLVLGVYLK